LDVLYGSKDQQFDLPSNQQYQNILMNGGFWSNVAHYQSRALAARGTGIA
jgi:hypothetical protein